MKTRYVEFLCLLTDEEFKAGIKAILAKYSDYDFTQTALLIEGDIEAYQITKEHRFIVSTYNITLSRETFYLLEQTFHGTLEEALDEIIKQELV